MQSTRKREGHNRTLPSFFILFFVFSQTHACKKELKNRFLKNIDKEITAMKMHILMRWKMNENRIELRPVKKEKERPPILYPI